ncbi:MAG: hypothetical protein QHH27_02955 [Clostridia bacterium]|jgi:hypothetical protein|nr:hypothetical protein [Clostridia bacterium]MDH7572495.1 hypothetical protein [Clostridia bacterium]
MAKARASSYSGWVVSLVLLTVVAGPEEPRSEEKSFWARLGDFFRRLWRR